MTIALHQLLPLDKSARQAAESIVTGVHHALQRTSEPLEGITRTYSPKDDDGDRMPDESTRVQTHVPDVLAEIRNVWATSLSRTFEKDEANTRARADVVLNGQVIIPDAPATYLLYLAKQLTHLRTLVTKLPRLDPAHRWSWDENAGAFATDSVETVRTKKVPRSQVMYEATDRHPAQVRTYDENVVEGYYTTRKFSSALPGDVVNEMVRRVNELIDAVEVARAAANLVVVQPNRTVGRDLLNLVLSPALRLRFGDDASGTPGA